MLLAKRMDASAADAPATASDNLVSRDSEVFSLRRQNSALSATTITLDMLPIHPIPCMQAPFEESIMESAEPAAKEQLMRLDAEARRRQLLEPDDDEAAQQQHSRWQQKADAKFHPLWKLIAQISFGIHLIHKKLARNDFEVVSLLQQHVDEVDGFIEDTAADFDLATRDIDERIRLLELPFEHNRVFNRMLCDKQFRKAMIDGNDIIRRILERTREAMKAALNDIGRGHDATLELAKFLQKLEGSMSRDQQLLDVYIAMRGNAEGWRRCFKNLRQKEVRLEKLMVRLEDIVDVIAKRAGIASRRKTNRNSDTDPSLPSLRRNSGGGSARDKPLPPEPPKKTPSTRSAKVQHSPPEIPQPARSSSAHSSKSQSPSPPQQPQQQPPSKPQHNRFSKSLSLPKPSVPKGGLMVTFAEGVKSPGPSTPKLDPSTPRRRSRSQKRYSNEIEVAADHMATTALIDRTSATPLTADSERRPSIPLDQPPPSSAYMGIAPDEEVSSKDVGDRPASSSIDILFDGKERTPQEEIALVLKGLGQDLYAITALEEEEEEEEESSPVVAKSSTKSPIPPSPSVFSTCSPILEEPSSINPQTAPTEADATVATSDASERMAVDDSPGDEVLPQPLLPSAKRKALPPIEELGEQMGIQSTADSIPLEGIPLSIEAVESIMSAEEDPSDESSEVEVYHIPPKVVEFSPIIETTALDERTEAAQSNGHSRRQKTARLASASAENLSLGSSKFDSPTNGDGPRRRGSDSTASRRPLGEKVSDLVGKYTHLDSKRQKEQTKPALHPINTSKTTTLSPVPEAVDSEDTSDVQEPLALDSNVARASEHDDDLISPTTQKCPRPETPTTPREDVSRLLTVGDDSTVDSKRLDPWDHRDSILKTPPGYVRRDRLDSLGGHDGEDSLERPSSFYLNPSRESSVASVIDQADEALCYAVTVPLPASRPGSSIAVPRILVVPDQGQALSKDPTRPSVDQAQSPDSYNSAETVRIAEPTELTSAPSVPAADLDIELTASPTGGTRVRMAATDTQIAESIRAGSLTTARGFSDFNASSTTPMREIQPSPERRDSGKNSASSAPAASEIVRVAVDMMPAFWPGQDRDSLLLDIGLLPGRDVAPESSVPVELPETKDGPRIPVEMDQEEPSKRLESRKLPRLETSMATASSWGNVIESSCNSEFSSGGSSSTFTAVPSRSHPNSQENFGTHSPSGQPLNTSVYNHNTKNRDDSQMSVKAIRSEPDLRASANLDGAADPTDISHTGSADTSRNGNRLSSRPDSQSIHNAFTNPGLSQSSSPTVGSPGTGEERSQRPSLISPNSETAVFSMPASTSRNGKGLAKPGNGSTTTLPSYFGDTSLNFAETLYIPRAATAHEQLAGEEAEISDETTALPSILTHPELSNVKKRLSIRRPNLNNLKGLSQRSINPLIKKAFNRKGAGGDSSSLNGYRMS